MIIIDGSKGEGGGQVLRTALSLSACTGQPFKINNIRGGRKKPGLLRQHLTCVKAATQICGGSATGAEMGATELTFVPGEVQAGEYQFDIGTAGSTGLVFQTVLPILLQADHPSSVRLRGGTHAKSAPPYEFLVEAFLPILRLMGADVEPRFVRHGFYPAGGGEWGAHITPMHAPKAVCIEPAPVRSLSAEAGVANLPSGIAARELAAIGEILNLEDAALNLSTYDAHGAGNVALVKAEFGSHTEVFTGFGEHGVSAETVAKRACAQAKKFLAAEVGVSEFLADQLLVPLACGAGGRFTTSSVSPHFRTNVSVIDMFLDVDICVADTGDGKVDVCVVR